MKTVTTPKGTSLPLVNLKGKDYLQVAHRIQWFNEETPTFNVETSFLKLTDDHAICQARVTVFDNTGRGIKSVMSTKSETKKDFPDFMEKAETGAIGRALALAGYGTQFALSDLDEGNRLADSPLVNAKAPKEDKKAEANKDGPLAAGAGSNAVPGVTATPQPPKVVSTFRKNKPATTLVDAAPVGPNNGWD